MSTWEAYQKPNIGLLFYKHIYNERPITGRLNINAKNELIIDIPATDKTTPFDEYYRDMLAVKAHDFEQMENTAFNYAFTLYTTYPGLLIGSGYQHDTKAKGDFKIGFYFDHTTGQPVIPGSSVKGILRSLFELDIPEKGKAYTGQKSVDAIKFICDEIIGSLKENEAEQKKWEGLKSSIDAESLRELKINIFGGDGEDTIMGSDIFFDSVINLKKTAKESPVFSTDFITPHQNPLKNPVPLQFLKVIPNIAFDFKFILTDTNLCTAEVKQTLFKQILLTLGAGAKTNVGYGQFTETKAVFHTEQKSGKKEESQQPKIQGPSVLDELIEPSATVKTKLLKDSVWPAFVYRIDKTNCLFHLAIDGEDIIMKKKLNKISFEVKEGDSVTVVFLAKYSNKEAAQFSVIKS